LATRFGVAAIDAVHDQAFGQMVALRADRIAYTPLLDVVGRTRAVDRDLFDNVAQIFFA
jgi:6-phosphofructokinase 1